MRALPTTPEILAAMAFAQPGLQIEFSPSAAYLKVGDTLWFAMLDAKDAA